MDRTQHKKQRLAHALQRLQQQYIQDVPAKLNPLMTELSRTTDVSQSDGLLGQLQHTLHQLAGSGHSFGCEQLSQQARSLELQLIEDRAEPARLLREDYQPTLLQALQMLLTCLDVVELPHALVADPSAVMTESKQIWLLMPDDVLVEALQQQLASFGFTVRIFHTIDACQAALDKSTPVLLLLYLWQHGLVGAQHTILDQTEWLAQIRQQHVPMMLLSPHDDFDMRVQAVQQGIEGFFVQPFDVPKMVSRIFYKIDRVYGAKGRVLIVDDDLILAKNYETALNFVGIQTLVVGDPREVLAAVVSFQPDLVLLDMHMPDCSGAELVGVLRQYDMFIGLPVVYLSAESDANRQLEALGHGADDFITKPISNEQLARVVQVRLSRSLQLKTLIEKDGLTGLLKHSAIVDVAAFEYKAALEQRSLITFVMVDIDHFKQVNDRFGHAMGDLVISSLSTLIQQRIRKADKAGRYGGEEFLLVLLGCDAEDAKAMVDSMLERFKKIQFNQNADVFNCSFSAGIASATSLNVAHADALKAAADKALYQAKNQGRSQTVIYHE